MLFFIYKSPRYSLQVSSELPFDSEIYTGFSKWRPGQPPWISDRKALSFSFLFFLSTSLPSVPNQVLSKSIPQVWKSCGKCETVTDGQANEQQENGKSFAPGQRINKPMHSISYKITCALKEY